MVSSSNEFEDIEDDVFSTIKVFAEIPEIYVPQDEAMIHLMCPRSGCHTELRVWKTFNHPWGDTVEAQCDKCGMIVRANNNVARKRMDISTASDSKFQTMHDIENNTWAPDSPGIKKKVAAVEKMHKEMDKAESKRPCVLCQTKFIPRANAKSLEQQEYCPDCRSNGTAAADVKLRNAEEKAKKETSKKRKEAAAKKKTNSKTSTKDMLVTTVETVAPHKVSKTRKKIVEPKTPVKTRTRSKGIGSNPPKKVAKPK